MEILNSIQKKLKAPKGQRNNFGNYDYRSCEDILEAVKPLLGEAVLTLTDDVVMIGDRFYVKAFATIKHKGDSITVSALARESLEKKGMDTAQITGAASSYARKYALNGLFLIDDTKDADTKDNNDKPVEKIDNAQISTLCDVLDNEFKPEDKASFLKYMKLEKLEDMLKTDYGKAMSAIEAKRKQVKK